MTTPHSIPKEELPVDIAMADPDHNDRWSEEYLAHMREREMAKPKPRKGQGVRFVDPLNALLANIKR